MKVFTQGQPFTPFLNHIKFVCYLKTGEAAKYENDIESLWTTEDGKYFGYYCMSGLSEITDRLFNHSINKYKSNN